MSKPLEILIDSDAFVGRFFPDDAHHQTVNRLFTRLEQAQKSLVTTNLVLNETATVLSHKSGQAAARRFLATIDKIKLPVIHINEQLQQATWTFFKKQSRKGCSVVDCANVVVMGRFHIATILSFDRFYARQSGIQLPAKAGLL